MTGRGFDRHAVNGGGDVQLAGGTGVGRPWRVGVVDPRDPARPVVTVELTDGAVATSGTTERGRHILDPFAGRPASAQLLSATVVGPSLTRADSYATACFAMGARAAREWIDEVAGYELLVVGVDGAVRSSSSSVFCPV